MENLIEVKGLSKKFKNFELSDVSFAVPAGSIVGFIGENASGKTTTLRLLLDLLIPNSGEIKIFGKPHNQLSKAEKEQIGVVLDSATDMFAFINKLKKYAKTNSILFDSWQNDIFLDLCKKFSIPEKGLLSASTGTKMKLHLAAALSHGAKLLILDEPVNGLDPIAREDFRDLMREFIQNENNSVLISSHILSDLEKICDFILFVHKGKIFMFDSKEQLLEKFVVLKCSKEEFAGINQFEVRGHSENAFGVEVLTERRFLRDGAKFEIPTLEQIMIFLLKNEVQNNEKNI